MLTAFIRLVTALSVFCGTVSVAMVAAVMLILCQLVVQQYGFGEYTTWQSEISTYLMIAIAFVGAPYVLLERGHIRVDLVSARLGASGRGGGRWLAGVASLFSLAFCLVLAWDGADLWREAFVEGWESDMAWGIRLWIPYLVLPFGLAVLSLQYIADILCLIAGREAPFPRKHGEEFPKRHGEES